MEKITKESINYLVFLCTVANARACKKIDKNIKVEWNKAHSKMAKTAMNELLAIPKNN